MADLGQEKPVTPEAEEEKPKGEDLADRFARLEKENQELKAQGQRNLEEVALARGQVQVILDQIQRAAASGDPGAKRAEKSLRDRFDEDPVSAMNDLVTMRVGPVVQEYLADRAQQEREHARKDSPDLFKRYGKEADEFMKDMPMDVKAKHGSFSQALQYVRALHVDEEVADARKEERERASRPEGASAAETEKPAKRSLERDEREVMKHFDMDEDDWRKWATEGGSRPKGMKKGKAA